MEPPEHGLLLRRPRNVKADRLADTRLIVHAYLFLGVIESLSAMSMYVVLPVQIKQRPTTSLSDRAFWYLQRHGYPFSTLALSFNPNAVPNDVLFKAQSVYFFTLVLMQWGYELPWNRRNCRVYL
jgi:sodium/potassium-transporting ATPase subunit alpha